MNEEISVWVVMGNDYPAAVFSTAEAAEAYCKRRVAENAIDIQRSDARRIYYRAYVYLLDGVQA